MKSFKTCSPYLGGLRAVLSLELLPRYRQAQNVKINGVDACPGGSWGVEQSSCGGQSFRLG